MNHALSRFREEMRSQGLNPPEAIEPGKFHRFPGVGKSNGNTAGWCVFFEDGLGGSFGDWSSDLSETWHAQGNRRLSQEKERSFQRQVKITKARINEELKDRQAKAAIEAKRIWDQATPAEKDHPYLLKKGVLPYETRQNNGDLVVPMFQGKNLVSLHFILPDGTKRFLPSGVTRGSYFHIGSLENDLPLCIAEGFATGASIHQATGYPVCVAFNAGNLKPVALTMRECFPSRQLILCADDDAETKGNPGLTKAREAALSVSGSLATPMFGDNRPEGMTDFNDMATRLGLEAVCDQIGKAVAVSLNDKSDWPEPQSLTAKVEREPYPLDAFPDPLRCAVEEVQGFTQAPLALVASSALAGLSLAIQSYVDVQRAEKLSGPVGLFLLTIADSGERKSTCDGYFTSAIREYEEQQAELGKPRLASYRGDLATWDAKKSAALDKIRKETKNGKSTDDLERKLREHEENKPEFPRIPRLFRTDETPESLAWALSKEWPSSGVISAEAGLVFGAHGMGKDSIMRNLSLLNTLWDGGDLPVGRKSSESFTVRGARLSVALQVQEATLHHFFDRSGTLARGSGFLARFLLAFPESTQGQRLFNDPPDHWPALETFNRRIAEILNDAPPIDEEGRLNPALLTLSPEAKAEWIAFHDSIEQELISGGLYHDVRDVASKTADNAARLAALFHGFEYGPNQPIRFDTLRGASKIARWYLDEARRFFGEFALPPELSDPARLDSWLQDYCQRSNTRSIARREIQRFVSPVHFRQGTALDNALHELVEAGRIRLINEGRRKGIDLNPALVDRNEG